MYVVFVQKKKSCVRSVKNVFLMKEKCWKTTSFCANIVVAYNWKNSFKNITMSDNKLVKTIMDAATLTGLAAGIGWASKKVLKEEVTANPSANVRNYFKFTAVMAASLALKQYLEDKKILPDSV